MSPSKLTKEILELALPITAENLLQTIVGSVDMWIVAKLGLTYVTAVGVANNLMALILAVFIAFGIGTNAILAQMIGARQLATAKLLATRILWITALIGLMFGLTAILFSYTFLSWMGLTSNLVYLGMPYFSWVGGTTIFLGIMTIASNLLRIEGITRFPLIVSILVNLINTILSTVLAFGVGGFPPLGVAGVALGTVLSRAIGCCILLFRLSQTKLWQVPTHQLTLPSHSIRQWLSVTCSAMSERFLMRGGQVIYMGMIASLSSTIYAAHSIAGTIESFIYLPAFGFAGAATILIAKSIGEGQTRDATRMTHVTMLWCVGTLSVLALVEWLGAPLWASFFTTDTVMIQQISIALGISAISQPFLAISQVVTGTLQGISDGRSPFIATAIGMLVIRVSGIYLLGNILRLGITGVWISILLDLIFRSIYLFVKWRTKRPTANRHIRCSGSLTNNESKAAKKAIY